LTAAYPFFFVDDDAANPLSNGRLLSPGTWPPGYAENGSPVAVKHPVQFGNAVANAVDLLGHLDTPFPDWNLDGDRGLAHMAWQFHNMLYTDPVAIEAES
jgi:hypothetical protein